MAVQQQVFPTALPYPWSPGERSFILTSDAGGPARVSVAFVSHAVVMPAVGTVWLEGNAGPVLSV